MAIWNTGIKNPNWKGGRSIASNGYVLIRVGVQHHLADIRGYAYEHRLVAEKKIGRRLRRGELVHHIDGGRSNNHPRNLEVLSSIAHHFVEHRGKNSKAKRMPGERNVKVCCACDCGKKFTRYDAHNRERRFISGHNPSPAPTRSAIMRILNRRGPMSRLVIAREMRKPIRTVAVVLSRLKRMGEIHNEEHGIWSIKIKS